MSISLSELSVLAHALVEAEREVDEADRVWKEKKERARQLREESIPAAMMELGLSKVTLDSGEQVSVKLDVFAAISAERKPEAFAWLEQHGFGGLIKTKVVTQFGKGELEQAKQLSDELNERGIGAALQEEVHPQTLKAFLREQLEAGSADLPLELFGAREVWVAVVK